ncbi:MAG TPA: hypothetical protein VFA67_05800 [Candidatus Sulfotelmatobacter sp.]|nr:hypothetical protein [Candidatus Sulfotelmatobacter sp.]
MLKIAEMLRQTNPREPARKRWCTAMILVAVCALTLSVATRYGSPAASDNTVTVVQKHSSWEPGLQRLLNNAATWMPPIVIAAVLYDLGCYPHVAPSSPPVLNVLLEKNLYNRPPPFPLSSFS